MPANCVVPLCRSSIKCVKMFACPYTDKTRWEAWCKVCPFLSKLSPRQLSYAFFCPLHFEPKYIINNKLSKDAIPSLCLDKESLKNVTFFNKPAYPVRLPLKIKKNASTSESKVVSEINPAPSTSTHNIDSSTSISKVVPGSVTDPVLPCPSSVIQLNYPIEPVPSSSILPTTSINRVLKKERAQMNRKRKSNQGKITKQKQPSRTYKSVLNEEDFEDDSEENLFQIPSNGSLSQICRVCLIEGDIPIYGDDSIGDISETLSLFGGIEIRVDDEFPKYLCHDCHGQLQSALKFRQTAQETDQLLNNNFLPVEEHLDIMLEEHLDIVEEKDLFKETLADENTIYHCKVCENDFVTSEEYGNHMFLENHSNLKDKCPFCCRDFNCIQKHLALHKLFKTVKCEVCGEKFIRPNFWRHQESHHNQLPYKCPHCPYRGRYGGDFKIHMRKHTGERPYQCSHCLAGFISKSNLNRHMHIHNDYFYFQCTQCSKGYNTQKKLDMHIKVDHIGVKEYLCNSCGKAYGYRKTLMKHQLQVHKREKLRGGKLPVYLLLNTEDPESNDHIASE